MILHVELEGAYLVMPGPHIQITEHFYLSDNPNNPTNHSDLNPYEIILTEWKTLQYVVGSTA